MIYTFQNRNASIAIIGDREANLNKYRFEVLFGFFNYKKTEKEKLRGVLTKKNFTENFFTTTKSLYTSYELQSRNKKTKVVINFFNEK